METISQSPVSVSKNALHKERWVEVTIRHGGFQRFVTNFLKPFTESLTSKGYMSRFYYHLSPKNCDILQLNCRTTQYHLDQFIKPMLFAQLTDYFGAAHLAQYGYDRVGEEMLQEKNGFEAYDWDAFRFIGIEEFSLYPLLFPQGFPAREALRAVITASTKVVLKDFAQFQEKQHWSLGIQLSKPILEEFLGDSAEIARCCNWLSGEALQLAESTFAEASADEKIGSHSSSLASFSESRACPGGHTFDSTQQEDQFSATLDDSFEPDTVHYDVSSWQDCVVNCREELMLLERKNELFLWEHGVKISEIPILSDLNELSVKKWRTVDYLLNMIYSQLGMDFGQRARLFRYNQRPL